jgi:hypothetical protein
MASFVRPVHTLALLACCLALAGCLGDSKSPRAAAATNPTPSAGTGNRAPAISGTPVTVARTNQPYSFQPKASDPDGDPLSFTVQNKPAWATFDGKTGKLAGTPSSSYTGTFSGIRIVASDGKAESATPTFSITVAATTATGSATLSWQPPTQNVDGSPLTNLAGFVIRYGTSQSAMNQVVRIDNPGITSSVVENLSVATWYFAVSAYTSAGVESAPSAVGSKTIS